MMPAPRQGTAAAEGPYGTATDPDGDAGAPDAALVIWAAARRAWRALLVYHLKGALAQREMAESRQNWVHSSETIGDFIRKEVPSGAVL